MPPERRTMDIDIVALENISKGLLIGVGISSLVFGIIFMVKPTVLQNLSRLLSKNIFSTEKLQHALEKQVDVDQWIINNNKVIGLIIIILASMILLQTIR